MEITFEKSRREPNKDFDMYDMYIDRRVYPEVRCYKSLNDFTLRFSYSNSAIISALSNLPVYLLAEQRVGSIYVQLTNLDEIASHIGANGVEAKLYLDELRRIGKKDCSCSVEFQINPRLWAKPWAIWDSLKAFQQACSELKSKDILFSGSEDDSQFYDFGLEIRNLSPLLSLAEILSLLIDSFSSIAHRATEILEERTLSEHPGLYLNFNFPSEFRSACEQYLMYFSQFLKDLGVAADSEVKQQASLTLFSVKPKDGAHALKIVQEALTAYLNLPTVSEHAFSASSDTAVQQLYANLLFLKSQLLLAHATLEHKEMTIKILSDSVRSLSEKATNEEIADNGAGTAETLLGGIVKVTSIEKYGVKLDLAALVRRLKRRHNN